MPNEPASGRGDVVAIGRAAKRVHIIYPHKEAALAICIKQFIEGYFNPPAEAFTFEHDVAHGTDWLDRLHKSLTTSDAAIALVSADAMTTPANRSWVAFETAAAWALFKDRESLLTVLHSGLTSGSLPEALRPLNAMEASSPGFAAKLMTRLTQILGLGVRETPVIPISDNAITTALSDVAKRRSSYDLFLAAPRNTFTPLTGQKDRFIGGLRDFITEITSTDEAGFSRVYPDDLKDPLPPELGVPKSLAALRRSEFFMMILPGKMATGALVEAGIALERGIPSIYWVKDPEHLPNDLRVAGTGRKRILPYKHIDEIAGLIRREGRNLFHWMEAAPAPE